jgi:glycosyltransferase involved in cell wall biosynthesis
MGNSYVSLYDCVDFVSSLNPEIHADIKRKEIRLIQQVDHFFVNSQALQSRFASYSPIVVPQGFDLKTFNSAAKFPSTKLRGIKNPIIGYVGGINFRLDYQLLSALALEHPEWSFVFVGEKQEQKTEDRYIHTGQRLDRLFSLKNVLHIEKQSKATLSSIISQFDVCLIPYNINIVFNQYCYPMKLFEYFYVGKPVISTPVRTLFPLKPYVAITRNSKEFSQAIHRALQKKPSSDVVKKQRQLARDNSWDAKVQAISRSIIHRKTLSSSRYQS